jgi:hypothetical protein
MFVGMINDYPFCCSEEEPKVKAAAIKMAETFGYRIDNWDYNGSNKDIEADAHCIVWTEEVPVVE